MQRHPLGKQDRHVGDRDWRTSASTYKQRHGSHYNFWLSCRKATTSQQLTWVYPSSIMPCCTGGMPPGRGISSSSPRRGRNAAAHRTSASWSARNAPLQAPSATTTPRPAWILESRRGKKGEASERGSNM